MGEVTKTQALKPVFPTEKIVEGVRIYTEMFERACKIPESMTGKAKFRRYETRHEVNSLKRI